MSFSSPPGHCSSYAQVPCNIPVRAAMSVPPLRHALAPVTGDDSPKLGRPCIQRRRSLSVSSDGMASTLRLMQCRAHT